MDDSFKNWKEDAKYRYWTEVYEAKQNFNNSNIWLLNGMTNFKLIFSSAAAESFFRATYSFTNLTGDLYGFHKIHTFVQFFYVTERFKNY